MNICVCLVIIIFVWTILKSENNAIVFLINIPPSSRLCLSSITVHNHTWIHLPSLFFSLAASTNFTATMRSTHSIYTVNKANINIVHTHRYPCNSSVDNRIFRMRMYVVWGLACHVALWVNGVRSVVAVTAGLCLNAPYCMVTRGSAVPCVHSIKKDPVFLTLPSTRPQPPYLSVQLQNFYNFLCSIHTFLFPVYNKIHHTFTPGIIRIFYLLFLNKIAFFLCTI